ncbi:MAG: DUF4157 domain-containing protein [Deltaproteobacteria bacterium]|nr:DUF4157 domain-containing protein [Deltaproteobacteria bacterium]
MQSHSPRSNGTSAAPESVSPVAGAQRVERGNAAAIEKMASSASKSASAELPHLERIQRAFGHHDLSDVRVSVGGSAGNEASTQGAAAYAHGQTIVFERTPDLHTAAHEAAHVVQQRSGAASATAAHEAHADRVADLVVQGRSAVGALDEMVGKVTPGRQQSQGKLTQMRWGDPPKKKVSSGSMKRLAAAKEAIAHTKSVIKNGAGNQYDALKDTNFNSYFRMKAMRDMSCWQIDPSVYALANKHPNALAAAMADLAGGGNCGEHAQIAYDYLTVSLPGEIINQCDRQGLDHAFVIIGDVKSESDSALAVSDPWPTAPTACLWEDHFAFDTDRAKLNTRQSETASGEKVKEVIARGLSLSAKGKAMINQTFDEARTKDELAKGTSRENGAHPWIWRHPNTARTQYDYHAGE